MPSSANIRIWGTFPSYELLWADSLRFTLVKMVLNNVKPRRWDETSWLSFSAFHSFFSLLSLFFVLLFFSLFLFGKLKVIAEGTAGKKTLYDLAY